jgi:hypothetical protein
MPFAVRALQVDGGSEFMADLEAECARRGVALFVLPPRSPKLNGHVERANGTHTTESRELTDAEPELDPLHAALLEHEALLQHRQAPPGLGVPDPRQWLERYTSSGADV